MRYDLRRDGLAVLIRDPKLECEHIVNVGDKLVGARCMALPKRAEIRDRLRVLSNPGTARKERLRTILTRNPLEDQPVYNNDQEYENYGVYESFQEKRAESRFSDREDHTILIYLALAHHRAQNRGL